jgi:vitamin B12 transporter
MTLPLQDGLPPGRRAPGRVPATRLSLRFSPRISLRLFPALLCTWLLPGMATPALAQAAAPALPTVVVVGSREPLSAARVAADVTVIDAARIRESTADSLEDLLRREAGVQLVRNGGPGANASLFVRGAGSGNTLVLVDGVRIGSATLGQPELEALSLAAIERIEVLRGPASSLYGADGSGGVILVFTRRGGDVPQAVVRAAAGGYGAREAAAQASGQVGDVDLAAGLSREQQDGVSALRPGDLFGNFNADIDGFRRRTAQARIGWQFTPGQHLGANMLSSRLDAQYDGSEFPPPTFAQDASPDFRNQLDTRVAALEHHATWSPAWATLLRTTTQEGDSHTGGNLIDRFRTQRRQRDAQATWTWAPGQQLTLAYEGQHEQALTTGYASERDNDAFVLAYAGAVDAVDVQADLRQDDNSVYGRVRTGRLGAALPLGGGWRLRALAGTSFRAPSFNDLFYPGYGVDSIRPERSRSLELGVDGRVGLVDLAFTAYRNQARDLIAYEPDPDRCPDDPAYSFGCASNIARARLQGLSAGGRLKLARWDLRAALELLDATDADTGERIDRRAAHQTHFSAHYDGGTWNADAALLEVGSRPDNGAILPAYLTLDLQAAWRIGPQWSLQARLLNAADASFQPARDYRPLGRQAWLGLRWDLQDR